MTNWDRYVVNGYHLKALGDLAIYSDEDDNVIVVDEPHDAVVFRSYLAGRSWLDFFMDLINWLKEDENESRTWQKQDGEVLNKYDER